MQYLLIKLKNLIEHSEIDLTYKSGRILVTEIILLTTKNEPNTF
jgi:hypothetical protein